MFRRLFILFPAALLALAGCGGGSFQGPDTGETAFSLVGGLPDVPRLAAATGDIDGVDYLAAGPGLTEADPAVQLDAAGIPCSWALYGFAVTDGWVLNSLAVDAENVIGDYYIGISDYGVAGTWEFHGPYTGDATVSIDGDPGRYVSGSGNFHWVVLSTADGILDLVSSTVDYTGMGMPLFRVPPAGMQTAAPSPAADPSLVIMDEVPGSSEAGAPVVFYTAEDEGQANSFLSWYNGNAWESRVLDNTKRYTHARGYRDSEGNKVIAYYHGSGDPGDESILTRIFADDQWNVTGTEIVSGPYDKEPVLMRLDYCEATDTVAVMCSYNAETAEAAVYTVGPDWSAQATDLSFTDYNIVGVDVAFSPDGTTGMAIYSFGTYDDSETIILDYYLKYATYSDHSWTFSPSQVTDYEDHEPLSLDVHYTDAGDCELVMVAARDLTISLIGLTATIYYDIALGEFDGSDWSFEDTFTSSINIDLWNSELDVDLGADCSWAAPDAMFYANVDGTVEYTLSPSFALTGGALSNNTNYLVDDGTGYDDDSYFTGDPGITFSWAAGPDGPACAYLNVEEADINDLLNGGLEGIEADIVYWSP